MSIDVSNPLRRLVHAGVRIVFGPDGIARRRWPARPSVGLVRAGRRPEGFHGGARTRPGTSPAEFFAACAELEGASISAFAILAAELEHHGAPADLVWRARGAIRDEARHFKLCNRLARRFGGDVVACPRVEMRPPRALAAIARENVTEGCVSETFAAATALWQAATARDQEVRSVMAVIAEDELAHAQLAWDVHAWASARLGAEAGAALERARAEAAHELLHACDEPVDAELVTRVGVPSRAAAAWLVARATELWRPSAA